jgi:membrane associated rhomboid family serine protease
MIPLRDNIRAASRPVVTYALIGLNLAVFAYEFLLGPAGADFLYTFGLVPARLLRGELGDPVTWLPVLTSMFLHAGLLHVAGNMLFLWVFGDNVEDRMGKPVYLAFYLIAGLVAAAAQVALAPGSRIPIVGASGAVAGVLGAYIVLYPRARVLTLVPIFVFIQFMELPAFVVLGLWFLLQFANGWLVLAAGEGGGGGVAWWAHIGGFALGLVAGALTRLLTDEPDRPDMYRAPYRRRVGLFGEGTPVPRDPRWP